MNRFRTEIVISSSITAFYWMKILFEKKWRINNKTFEQLGRPSNMDRLFLLANE
jgi:hypothetical protein